MPDITTVPQTFGSMQRVREHFWFSGKCVTPPNFFANVGASAAGFAISEAQGFPAPAAGLLRNLRVRCPTNAHVESIVFTVRVNGSDTALTVTVPSPAGVGSTAAVVDDTHFIAVAEGDRIDLRATGADAVNTALVVASVELV